MSHKEKAILIEIGERIYELENSWVEGLDEQAWAQLDDLKKFVTQTAWRNHLITICAPSALQKQGGE